MNFWVLVAFVGFLGSAFQPLKRHLLTLLDAHAERIKEGFHEAQHMQKEAESLLQSTKEKHLETTIQIKEIFELAHQEALHLQKKMEEENAFYLTLKDQLLSRRITHSAQKAQQEIRYYLIHQAFAEVEDSLQASLEKAPLQEISSSVFLERFKRALAHFQA